MLQRRSNTASRMDDYVAEEKRAPEKRPKCHRCRVSTAGGSRKIARLHGVCFDFPVILKGIKHFEKKTKQQQQKDGPITSAWGFRPVWTWLCSSQGLRQHLRDTWLSLSNDASPFYFPFLSFLWRERSVCRHRCDLTLTSPLTQGRRQHKVEGKGKVNPGHEPGAHQQCSQSGPKQLILVSTEREATTSGCHCDNLRGLNSSFIILGAPEVVLWIYQRTGHREKDPHMKCCD